MDPSLVKLGEDVATLGATAWASKDIVAKLLGPTADYLGGEIAGLTRKCNINISDIFDRATRKLGNKLDDHGQVNPRILKGILSDGAFTEDSLAAEYFGGVLASSRTQTKRDDRGLSLLAVIRDMSCYELRLHYICYHLVKQFYNGSNLKVQRRPDTEKLLVFLPANVFDISMELGSGYSDPSIIHHSIHGLHRLTLIGNFYAYGGTNITIKFPETPSGGVLLQPSAFGAELYLWAQGRSDIGIHRFLETDIEFEDLTDVVIPDGALRVILQNGVPILA
jgi:hypothetical protein